MARRRNPTPTRPLLYERVKAEAKEKFDVWPSAYASGWLVQEYKRRGGGYVNPEDTGLTKWFGEEWVDLGRSVDKDGKVKKWVQCGRKDASKGKYPKCVPKEKAKKMSPKQRLSAVKRKRAAEKLAPEGKGRAPVNVKTIVNPYRGERAPERKVAQVRGQIYTTGAPAKAMVFAEPDRSGYIIWEGHERGKQRQVASDVITSSVPQSTDYMMRWAWGELSNADFTWDPSDVEREENPRRELYIKPNKSAVKVAKRALERRKKLPKSKRGGLDPMEAYEQGVGSGVMRARDIANGKKINAYQVKAFFDRHRKNFVNANLKGLDWEDSKALQSWDLWGGEPLRKQVEKAVAADKKRAKNPAQGLDWLYESDEEYAARMDQEFRDRHGESGAEMLDRLRREKEEWREKLESDPELRARIDRTKHFMEVYKKERAKNPLTNYDRLLRSTEAWYLYNKVGYTDQFGRHTPLPDDMLDEFEHADRMLQQAARMDPMYVGRDDLIKEADAILQKMYYRVKDIHRDRVREWKRNPYRRDKFQFEGVPAALEERFMWEGEAAAPKQSLMAGWGDYEASKQPYTGQLLIGGKADELRPEDFDPIALAKGTAVEMEHTNDPAIAREIAMDHLAEDPDYYEYLEAMERIMERKRRGRQ